MFNVLVCFSQCQRLVLYYWHLKEINCRHHRHHCRRHHYYYCCCSYHYLIIIIIITVNGISQKQIFSESLSLTIHDFPVVQRLVDKVADEDVQPLSHLTILDRFTVVSQHGHILLHTSQQQVSGISGKCFYASVYTVGIITRLGRCYDLLSTSFKSIEQFLIWNIRRYMCLLQS